MESVRSESVSSDSEFVVVKLPHVKPEVEAIGVEAMDKILDHKRQCKRHTIEAHQNDR